MYEPGPSVTATNIKGTMFLISLNLMNFHSCYRIHFLCVCIIHRAVADVNMTEVLQNARDAKFVLLCLGEDTYTEKPGDINDLNLAQGQIEVITLCMFFLL